jgi:HTH-type transcriptional regulator/antitoxin HigA
MNERVPAEVFPPGEFVKDELKARGWTQADLAEILGRTERTVSEIVNGKRSLTPEMARGLGEAFCTDPQFWMNLEATYQLAQVRRTDDAIARRAKLYALVPMKEMIRRHWIEASENVDVMEQRVMSFLELRSLDDSPSFNASARSPIAPTPLQCAWLARARQLARALTVQRFAKGRLDTACDELRRLLPTTPELRHVSKILAEAGIRFVVVEGLPGSRIDGAAFWLDAHSPVVAMTIRYDRLDSFWFTLMHELAHVKNGDGASLDENLVGDDSEATDTKAESERKADEFSGNFLVADREFNSFVARVGPLYSRLKIAGFANRLQIHPGIVVGRLQKTKRIPYSHHRELLEKVRSIVLETALSDGWGSPFSADTQRQS